MQFEHFNFNVLNLDRSLKFYDEALGLKSVREIVADDGSFKLVYLGDEKTDFQLEFTWLRDRKEPYNLGECEYHLALNTDKYEYWFKKHKEMGVVSFVNEERGIYFIVDPDGYWIEILPR